MRTRTLLAKLEQVGADHALEREIATTPSRGLVPELEAALQVALDSVPLDAKPTTRKYRAALSGIIAALREDAAPLIPILLRQARRQLTDARYDDGRAYAYGVGALGMISWIHAKQLLASKDRIGHSIGEGVYSGLTRSGDLDDADKLVVSSWVVETFAFGEWDFDHHFLLMGIVHLGVVTERANTRLLAFCAKAPEGRGMVLCESYRRQVRVVTEGERR